MKNEDKLSMRDFIKGGVYHLFIVIIILFGSFSVIYAADIVDYRLYVLTGVNKPIANFTVTVIKPDGNIRTSGSPAYIGRYDIAYDINGKPVNPSLINKITVYVGDTIMFTDNSNKGSGTLITCDFQWYSNQTSGKVVESINQFNSRTFTLTQTGTWQLYYNVCDDYLPNTTVRNWSDNGYHVTIDYKNFPEGIKWYYVRLDVNVLLSSTSGSVTTIYRGWDNDGSVSEIRSSKVTNKTITGDTAVSVTETVPTISGYDFVSSAIGTSENSLTDILNGVTSRTVEITAQNPNKFIVFTYQQKAAAGTPSLGITVNPLYVSPGQSYTVSDLSRPSEGASSITKWRVKEEFTPKSGGSKQTIFAESEITSPGTFFKSYTKAAEGTYRYTITSVTDNLNRTKTGTASVDVVVGGSSAPANKPPIADFVIPSRVTQGDTITVDASVFALKS